MRKNYLAVLIAILFATLLLPSCEDEKIALIIDNEPEELPEVLNNPCQTIIAPDGALVGDIYLIDGTEYLVVNRASLDLMILNNEDISKIITSLITNMDELFRGKSNFNQDISSWDVSNVTSMRVMFMFAETFNQNISCWNVAKVVDMNSMFMGARAFNADLSTWNVSNVSDMSLMFALHDYPIFGSGSDRPMQFNSNISAWDVSKVKNMAGMFRIAESFDQPIGSWDVSEVNNMRIMFNEATKFNQDLSSWDVENVTDCYQFVWEDVTNWTQPRPNFVNCNPN